MSKKAINQNTNYVTEFINFIDINFLYNEKPIKRLKNKALINSDQIQNKKEELIKLKDKLNAIENCKLKKNSNKTILGNGNLNSPIIFVGGTPDENDEKSGNTFEGQIGELFTKMLSAINIERKKIYTCYAINFRPPFDRKPTTSEIKRYSSFLQNHISIINPKIIILLGSTAMEAVTGLNSKISNERGKWKEIILKNKTFPLMITFSPSYLIRFPENKKYSWEDLKKIKQKIKDLNLKI